jgi:bifunctional oligoribonuclease and PAP phosphatase NrnA
MTNFTFSFLEEQIKKSQRPLLLTHVDPDGDALGSVMATKSLIEELGVKPYINFSGKINADTKVTDKSFFVANPDIADYDLFIVLDTSNLARTGVDFPEHLSTPVIIIDHHIKKEGRVFPPNFHTLINSDATATCEIIYDLLAQENRPIGNTVASYLFLGIYTDSGGFFHSNTTPQLLKKVKELIKKGVLFKNITQNAFRGKRVPVLNFWGEKITSAKFHPRLKYIQSQYSQKELEEKGISVEEIGGPVNLLNLLNMPDEVLFSLMLSDLGDGKIRGSLRSSERKGFNVNTISRVLGGGGHRLAAGFEVPGKIVDKGSKIKVKKV